METRQHPLTALFPTDILDEAEVSRPFVTIGSVIEDIEWAAVPAHKKTIADTIIDIVDDYVLEQQVLAAMRRVNRKAGR